MAGKKLKKGKKKKLGKKKRELLPNLYDVPDVPEIPRNALPVVRLNMKLVNPLGYPMDFQLEVPINTKVMTIHDKIAELYGGAARDISISLHKYRPDDPAPLTASLMELGLIQSGDVNVFYDFKPVSHPLLT
ncbi:unnamed protein product [Blepharisma stoltei]|uniref:Uncharacterized protein n=1 Tax=Blepharisma stoltei TaxID=1481888 RepID=A0AAU9JBA6_9CILI|nr:unnamed protein product [Blepharisma stoltei]